MSETFYRIDYSLVPPHERPALRRRMKDLGVLEPVEPDYEAMATAMNVAGWTCDGHEPGAWCEDCKRLQLSTAKKMWRAGIGDDDGR